MNKPKRVRDTLKHENPLPRVLGEGLVGGACYRRRPDTPTGDTVSIQVGENTIGSAKIALLHGIVQVYVASKRNAHENSTWYLRDPVSLQIFSISVLLWNLKYSFVESMHHCVIATVTSRRTTRNVKP